MKSKQNTVVIYQTKLDFTLFRTNLHLSMMKPLLWGFFHYEKLGPKIHFLLGRGTIPLFLIENQRITGAFLRQIYDILIERKTLVDLVGNFLENKVK